jgi:hypothetical protein
MRIPSWVVVTAAVVAAFPFGWGVGVFIAILLVGRNLGELASMTVPLAIAAAVAFALSPFLSARTRLAIMVVGTGLFVLLGPLLVG